MLTIHRRPVSVTTRRQRAASESSVSQSHVGVVSTKKEQEEAQHEREDREDGSGPNKGLHKGLASEMIRPRLVHVHPC